MAKTEQGNGLEVQESRGKLTDNGNGGSFGSEPEVNGNAISEGAQVDKYGFTGGAQQSVLLT